MPNGREDIYRQKKPPEMSWQEWERRVRGQEQEVILPPPPPPPEPPIEEGPSPAGTSWEDYEEAVRRPEHTEAELLKTEARAKELLEWRPGPDVKTLEQYLNEGMRDAPPELHAEYRRKYEEYRKLYDPAYKRHRAALEVEAVAREEARTRSREKFSSELVEAGLTESEVETIWVNLGYIERTSRTEEEAQERWKAYMVQWGPVTTRRAREAGMTGIAPAWEAYYKATGDPIGAGFVSAFDWLGKGLADVWQRTTGGKPIDVRPPKVELTSSSQLLFYTGELGGIATQAYLGGKVAGIGVRVFGPPIAKAFKIVTISPFTKVAPRISPIVASQWAAAGTKVVGAGKTVLAHPTAVKVAAYGAWGGYEAVQVKEMYEAGVSPERIFGKVGKDIALIVGFSRGFAKGLETEYPIGISRVKVGERTLYTGLRVGQRPIIGKTPEGWALGWPKYAPKTTKDFLFYAAKVEYAPGSMFESRFVSKELFPALKRITPGEYAGAMKSWGIRLSTKGARPLVKRDIVEVWRDIFARQKIGQKAYEDVLKVLRSQAKRIEFYGSSVKQAQTAGIYAVPEEYAVPGDIDVMVKNVPKLADDVVKAINKYHPGAAWVRTSQGGTTMIVTKYGKLFDVHAAGYGDVLPSVKWGLGAEPKVKISGFKVTTLSEETTHAWWSIGTLREAEGKIMFWPESKRVKDIWRFLGAEAELSISKGVPSKFPPVEEFWLGKLHAAGYTSEQIAAMMKDATTASRLIYSMTPSVSYPSLAISGAAIPIFSAMSSLNMTPSSLPSSVLSSPSYMMPSKYPPSSMLSSSGLPSSMQPSPPSRGPPSYKPPSLPSGLPSGYPSISSVFSPSPSPPSPYPYSPPSSPPPSSPPYSYPPSPPKPSPPSGFPPILQLGEPEAEPRQSFDVYVKRKQMKKGKGSYLSRGFKKVNVKPLSKESALGLGMSIADQFTNAQGFIKKRRDKPGRASRKYEHLYHQLRHKFRFPRRKGKAPLRNRFVEKTTFRIDSPAELSGIPYEAQRLRKAGLIGTPTGARVPRQRVVRSQRGQLANVLAQPRVKAQPQRKSAKLDRIFGEESEKKKAKVFG